jgi:choline dehydrogenase-like flavoprotein
MALAQKGLPVTILDAGGELETEIQGRVDLLATRDDATWTAGELSALKGELRRNAEGAPLKLLFGSDFPYRDVEQFEPTERRGVDVYRGMARGGLSTLWGASILPYNAEDLEGWPIGERELAPHFRAVLGMTGISAETDELAESYPLYVNPDSRLRPSRQAARLLARMRERKAELAADGIYFGRSRLAIREREGRGCVHCGMCLYGCPYGLIYSAGQTLRDTPGVQYVGNAIVRRVHESSAGVEIEATGRDGGRRSFRGDRVFLAAGAYSSTRILLESGDAYDRPVRLRQSDHFLVPILLKGLPGDVMNERLHTLSQLYLGRAFEQDRHQKMIALAKPYGPIVSIPALEQDARARVRACRQEHAIAAKATPAPVPPGRFDLDAGRRFVHSPHDRVTDVLDSGRVAQSLPRAVNQSVRTTVEAHPAMHTAASFPLANREPRAAKVNSIRRQLRLTFAHAREQPRRLPAWAQARIRVHVEWIRLRQFVSFGRNSGHSEHCPKMRRQLALADRPALEVLGVVRQDRSPPERAQPAARHPTVHVDTTTLGRLELLDVAIRKIRTKEQLERRALGVTTQLALERAQFARRPRRVVARREEIHASLDLRLQLAPRVQNRNR